MALYSKTDFAELCGLSSGNLANYITRGKVITSGKFIDLAIVANAEFLRKRKDKADGKAADKAEPKEAEVKAPAAPAVKKPATVKGKEPVVYAPKDTGHYELDRQRKVLDIEAKKLENEKTRAALNKINGQVIPTDLVKILMGQHSKSIMVAFKNAADGLLTLVAKKAGLNRNDVAELKGELIGVVNQAVNDSIAESRKMIKNIVAEYSAKKGVGEHS